MSLPIQITLKGRYVKTKGAVPSVTDVPETGKVTIISDEFLKSASNDDICAPHSIVAKLDDDGSFEVSVISTDDPAWLPVNRTLVIKEALSGGARTYRITVPSASPGGVLDLADVSPVADPTAPVTYILVSSFVAKGDILVGTGQNNFARLPIGANSQVLSADSSTPTGTRWVTGGGGGGISPTIIDAKGDLIVGVASDVPDRLPVGSNGQFIKANSALTLGMGWASLTKSDVGLANVDNTSDVNKPVSSATQAALDGKQPLSGNLTTIAGLAPSNDDILQRKAGAWTNRTMAQLKADLTLTKSDVGLANVDNTSDATKFTNTTLTGQTTINRVVNPPDVITISAGNADTDASLGNTFKLTANAAFVLTNPSNLSDMQRLTWQIKQDATGGRVMTLGSKFAFGADITAAVLSTGANKIDYLNCVYSATEDKLHVVSFLRGY